MFALRNITQYHIISELLFLTGIELSINKQSVTLDCVIIYKFPAFCKQTPWRIQRSNKEVSM